jgi:hypothetical protein
MVGEGPSIDCVMLTLGLQTFIDLLVVLGVPLTQVWAAMGVLSWPVGLRFLL